MTHSTRLEISLGPALRIIEDAWEELRRSFFVQQQIGTVAARLPEVSPSETERRSCVGRSLRDRIDAIDMTRLPHDLVLTLRLARFRAQYWAREAEFYWTAVDPLGIGFFGMFLPSAYCGGFLLSFVHRELAAFQFNQSGDCDRYLALVADYARLIDQFSARTAGQADRGIYMPRPQVQQGRVLLQALKEGLGKTLMVEPERLKGVTGAELTRELEQRIRTRLQPAFDAALAGLSDSYLAKAPESVGLGQYPGGREIYDELVKLHTTLDLSAEQVHARGLARMAEIEADMATILRELGFNGSAAEFKASLDTDPRWRADTAEGVTAVFQRYIDRLKPEFGKLFDIAPKMRYGIEPLPKALQGSMTFGYYEAPRRDHPRGTYFFNSGNLTKQTLINVGALTYHELVPGHHLHFASQQENDVLHPFRTYSFVNAYNEGWAEYAATLAGEIGMYQEPEERYGRLVQDAFLTSRLVVDTGMNVLGWSLHQAREYMRVHSGMAEAEILSETLRYSCDLPGQALAYKLGDTEIFALRERVRSVLGPRFSLREFHNLILGPGALPIPVLAWHVEREIQRSGDLV